jgi:protein ImuB
MLWLCIHFPNLALDVFARGGSAVEPLAVSRGRGREQQVFACNPPARRRGVQPGMRLSAAYAQVNNLRVHERDEAAERAALDRLIAWAGQYTSFVSQAPPQAVLLEIAGSLVLFGGLDRLLQQLRRGVKALGYEAVLCVAPTPLGATWLARAGREARLTDHQALSGALFSLPLSCLDVTAEQRAVLHGMGIRDLGACLRLPRDGLARRLGPVFVSAIDRAFDRLPDPRPAFAPPPKFDACLSLPAPVSDTEGLLFPVHRLLLELCGFLAAREAGVRALGFVLRHAKVPATRVALELVAPARDPRYLTALMRERLERVVLPEPVEEVRLRAVEPQPVAGHNLDFFRPAPSSETARTAIVERLQARLGRKAVCGLCPVAEHRPERAWRYIAPGEKAEGAAAVKERPLWLLPAPLSLTVRDGRLCFNGGLNLETSRERIESGWWDGAEIRRDYFIARDAQGTRLWIFRELDGARRWFLHGVFE